MLSLAPKRRPERLNLMNHRFIRSIPESINLTLSQTRPNTTMSLTSTPSLESALQERLLLQQRSNDDAAFALMHMGSSSPAGPVVPESNADVMPAYEAMLQQRADDNAAFALMFIDHL